MNNLETRYYFCKCGLRKTDNSKLGPYCRKCRPNKGGHFRETWKIVINGDEFLITTRHKLYMLRHHIIERCYRSKKDQKWYKNINVCNEWMKEPVKFYEWALNNGWAPGLTIDRIDPAKDYCPENCRFLTRAENARRAQQKITREQAVLIKALLKSTRICDIARDLNINYSIIKNIKLGNSWKEVEG